MQTIRLRVNDRIFKHLMWFLERFTKDELQVIKENDEFISVQQYLKAELVRIEDGTAEFISIDELDNELESTILKHEA
ncbi:MAG TPA: tRNA pseudouridine synthase A [Bacteroidales bacterium]|nr:tRNA pseudouridine synthase A [Bacteroidales bacterium]